MVKEIEAKEVLDVPSDQSPKQQGNIEKHVYQKFLHFIADSDNFCQN